MQAMADGDGPAAEGDRLDSARQRSCGLRQSGLCASGGGRADPRRAQPRAGQHRADSARPPPVTADIACTAGRGSAQVGRLPAVRAGRECAAAWSRGLHAVQLGPRGVCAAAGSGCRGRADCAEPGAHPAGSRLQLSCLSPASAGPKTAPRHTPPCTCTPGSSAIAVLRPELARSSVAFDSKLPRRRPGWGTKSWKLLLQSFNKMTLERCLSPQLAG